MSETIRSDRSSVWTETEARRVAKVESSIVLRCACGDQHTGIVPLFDHVASAHNRLPTRAERTPLAPAAVGSIESPTVREAA